MKASVIVYNIDLELLIKEPNKIGIKKQTIMNKVITSVLLLLCLTMGA